VATLFSTHESAAAASRGVRRVIIGVQLPEVREIDTRRRLCQLYPDARDLRPPQNVEVAIEGASPTTSKTLFDVLLPVAPPRAHT
jgi:hypothetical protein